jgi:hypothetical protein
LAIRVAYQSETSRSEITNGEAALLTFTEGRAVDSNENRTGWFLSYRRPNSDQIRSQFIPGARDDVAWAQQEAKRVLEQEDIDTSLADQGVASGSRGEAHSDFRRGL